ncbi:RHS repeat protein [Polyangium jinanense]|uniref:RHS repeat-associated core domain-containing protein n=1 Tax=Polyangium jinanense TaxID=2829994 RepID=UPI002341AE04|nr:RHS repeat-associated core domain-containing protein [Polyangium jinanense]MDC3956956.1 RHS repeat protein [Polyangium jinanense]
MPTSPVPDAAAPPGMCPGVVVKGGGMGSGGGDGDGKGGGDGSRGNGQGEGEGASGDGKGACGSGKNGGACPNHHAGKGSGKASKGDPVDVVTGRVFTVPVTDLHLPGPLPVTFVRGYNSAARDRDVGLGPGWHHSYAWEVEMRRSRTRLWTGNGMFVDFAPLSAGEAAVGPDGWVLVCGDTGFVLDRGDGRWLIFEHRSGDRWLLSAEADSHDNRVSFIYEKDRLIRIEDAVGRTIHVRATREGRIQALEVKNTPHQGRLVAFARYLYDEAGDLVAAENAAGAATKCTYSDHLLTVQEYPTGLRFSFLYDGRGRCIETWGEYARRPDESLATSVPRVLADGTTRAKGIFHTKFEYGPNGYTEVVDSISLDRFFGNELGKVDKSVTAAGVFSRTYDAHGNVLSFTDALGATTIFERDARGREVRVTDPLGRVTTYERDADGHIVRAVDPAGGVIETQRVRGGLVWRDAIGARFEVRFDRRGLTTLVVAPNGGETHHRYDDYGNEIERVDPTGATTRFTYDYWGRRQSMTDPTGAVVTYTYDEVGRLRSERTPDGGVTSYAYDDAGNCVEVRHPTGAATTHRYAGYNKICETREPDGRVTRYRYDREGRLIEVHNSRGEVHRIERNAARLVSKEDTFDGRTLRYKYDAMGRMIVYENGLGQKIEYVRDLVGRVVEQIHDDGTRETFEYDELDGMRAAHGPSGDVHFERNPLGWLTRETQSVHGRTFDIWTTYDVMGFPTERRTSLGHRQTWERDLLGRAVRVTLDGKEQVGITRDLAGREVTRFLPQGGRIDITYDSLDRIVRRTASRAEVGQAMGHVQSARVSAVPHDLSVEQVYRYSLDGDVAAEDDRVRGAVRWEHDSKGQVLSRVDARGRGEHFRYDTEGNVHEYGPGALEREYGVGNVLHRRGPASYVWDGDGRLMERRIRVPGGDDLITRYEWDHAGMLRAVVRPDGTRIEHIYDPLARRLQKRVSQVDAAGRSRLRSTTWFVWDGATLVHEIKQSAAEGGDPVVEERTYCADEDTGVPWAHRDVRRAEDGSITGSWYHYLNDAVGMPERLLDGAANVACDLERSTWGAARPREGARTQTPLRFLGQYFDEETGLAFNRHRYYDPALGRYISADPIGLLGGRNSFAYADNRPTKLVDPTGLMDATVSNRRDAKGNTLPEIHGKSSNVTSDEDLDPALKEAVVNARDKFRDPRKPADHPDNRGKPEGSSKDGRCAEIDVLNQQARDIRKRLSKAPDGKPCPKWENMSEAERNARIRNELREEYRRGAEIEAHQKKKKKRSSEKPCPFCAQVYRELGIHPDNINADPNDDVPDAVKKSAGLTTGTSEGGVIYNGKKWSHEDDGVYDPDQKKPGANVARESKSATPVVPKLKPDGSQQMDKAPYLDSEGNYLKKGQGGQPTPKFVPPEDD